MISEPLHAGGGEEEFLNPSYGINQRIFPSLSAPSIPILINSLGLDRYRKFCLHVDDPALALSTFDFLKLSATVLDS